MSEGKLFATQALWQTQKNVSEPQTAQKGLGLSSKQFSFHLPSCKSFSYIYIYICMNKSVSRPAQPCSSLSTGKSKLCGFTCLPDETIFKTELHYELEISMITFYYENQSNRN